MHASLAKKSHRTLLAIAAVCLAATIPVRAVTLTIGFDDTGLEPGTYVNGSDGYRAYYCGQVRFDNNYNFQYHSWDGFALSRVNNPTVGGWSNQYAVWGDGLDRSDGGGYAVVFYGSWSGPASLTLPYDSTVRGLFVNNTAYAADSMLNGDSFAKKFGGKSGKDPDWLKLIITGYDAAGNPVGTNEFYLADYRFADNEDDYIISDWTWVDLAGFGNRVRSLAFAMDSSDSYEYEGETYYNTPFYFAMDDLRIVPTPSLLTCTFDDLRLMGTNTAWKGDGVLPGFSDLGAYYGNAFSDWGWGTSWSGFGCSRVNDTNTPGYKNDAAVWGDGRDRSGSGNYAVFFDAGDYAGPNDRISFVHPAWVKGFYVNNTTYAALSMLNGDSYAKKFGGDDGTEPDWFKLTITARGSTNNLIGTKEIYLADYRSDNPDEDYILSDWTWVDLSELGPDVKYLYFSMSSSDSYEYEGETYYNTPFYFAMDELTYIHTFSDPVGGDNIFDAGIPGFVGEDGIGISDEGNNVVNPLFAAWASGVASYEPTPDVWPQWQKTSRALGPVTGNYMDIVSLGDLTTNKLAEAAGRITLTFDVPISDKEGPDFAVFENGFIEDETTHIFAELGYVEVSSDGVNFARFPSASLCTNDVGPYGSVDARYIHNLCGRHVNHGGYSWGTPFDLGDLAAHPLVLNGTVCLTNITHVRIEDIPGEGSRFDSFDPPNPIRDAWYTWGSGGVDLEAIGVINSAAAARIDIVIDGPGQVAPIGYPQRAVSVLHGADQTFTFTPGATQMVVNVMIDGVSIGATNQYTFTSLDRDHTLAVTFGPLATIHGVPVAWLDAWGLAGASDEERALSDPDNDGMPSWQEYYAGTNPLDPLSRFTITGFAREGNKVSLSWLGGTSGSPLPFVVIGAPTPTGTWSTLAGDLPRAASGTNIWSGTATPEMRFFRVQVPGAE